MTDLVITPEIAVRLIRTSPGSGHVKDDVSVIINGIRTVGKLASVAHKLGYCDEIVLMTYRSHAYKTNHAIRAKTKETYWYIATDKRRVDSFFKNIAIN